MKRNRMPPDRSRSPRGAGSSAGTPRQAARHVGLMLCILILFSASGMAQDPPASPPAPTISGNTRVLVLCAYHSTLPAYGKFNPAFLTEMTTAGIMRRQVFFEYLDLLHLTDRTARRDLADLLNRKYRGRGIDLIVTLHGPALDFTLEEAASLLPGVPVIAWHLRITSHETASRRWIAEMVIGLDFNGTLKAAMDLFPETRQVFFVGGVSQLDRLIVSAAEAAYAQLDARPRFAYLSNLPIEETLHRVAHLPSDSLVIFGNLFQDATGRMFTPEDIAQRIAEAANAPVFGLYDTLLGRGLIGGSLLSFEAEGTRVGRAAVDMLTGPIPRTAPPPPMTGDSLPMFDWRQIERWSARADNLPEGSIFINSTLSPYNQYKWHVAAIFAFLLVETGLIAALLVQQGRRKQAEARLQQINEGLELRVAERTAELQRSERRLRLAVEAAYQLTFEWDIRRDEVRRDISSDPALPATPAAGAVSFASVRDTVHPDDRERFTRQVQAAVAAEDGHYQNAFRVVDPDGGVRWLQEWGVVERDPEGEPLRLVGLSQDITERKRYDRALTIWGHFYNTLDEAIPYGIWTADPAGMCTHVSDSFLEMAGMTLEQVREEGWLHLLPPEDVEPTRINWMRCVETGEDFNREHRFRSTDGTFRHVLAIGRPVRDRDGEIITWIGLNLDITEKKNAEADLRSSEQRFRLALRNAPVSLAAQDRDLRFIWAYNQKTARPEEIIGHFDQDIFRPEEAARLTAIKRRVLEENVEVRERMWFDRPGGSMFLDVCYEPIRDESGAVTGVATATVDLTPIKRAEEALRSSLADKEVLLHEVHHRVKNNMQVITSLVDLQAAEMTDPALRSIFQDVVNRVHSMAMVHEKLYRSSDLARVEFADYAETLLTHLQIASMPEGPECRIAVELDLQPVHLPIQTAVPCGLILNELFTNAIKHAFDGCAGARVAVSLQHSRQKRVQICVRDNGIGLPAEIDWRTPRSLGLRLVQMLARQINGEVTATREEGTAFTISFERPTP